MDDLCEGLGRSHDICPDINWQSTCKFSMILYSYFKEHLSTNTLSQHWWRIFDWFATLELSQYQVYILQVKQQTDSHLKRELGDSK